MNTQLAGACRALSSLALLLATAVPAAAQTTVWIPCSKDNTLYDSPTGALSNGAGPGIFVGLNGLAQPRRALLRFDVAAHVPAGASIVSASLSVHVAQTNPPAPLPVTGHRVLQAWGEGASVAGGGGGGGAPAAANDATWLHAMSPSVLWTNPGGDFVAAPSFTMVTPGLGLATAPPAAGATADVQLWLDTPLQNHGWLLTSDETLPGSTARRLDSRESTTGIRPFLAVTYVVTGQSGLWGRGCPVGSNTFDLVLVGAPIGGSTVHHVHRAGPANSVGIFYFGLDLEPGGILLQPECRLYLSPVSSWVAGNLFVLDILGNGTSSWTHTTSFPGLYFVTQSAALDNSPLGLALTNAAVSVLQ